MPIIDDIRKNDKLVELLTTPKTDLLTPHLGKGNHLINSYYRIQFIAKVIEYMVYLASVYGIKKVSGEIILEAVGKTSWYLNLCPSYRQLEMLLIEVAVGLELLEIEKAGTIKVPNPLYGISANQETEIDKFLGYNFKLSNKGWESYKKQEYQILASNLFAAKISRYVSYTALIIALLSFLVKQIL